MTTNPPAAEKKISEYHVEHEIRLIDLVVVIIKHWAIIALAAIACVAIGVLYIINKPVIYEYTSIIEIGSYFKESELNGPEKVFLEKPSVLLSKINGNYIPSIVSSHQSAFSRAEKSPGIRAELIKGDELIRLVSQGTVEDVEQHLELHQAVMERANNEQRQILELMNQKTELQLQEIESKLAELKSAMELIEARRKRVSELSLLLSSEAEQIRGYLQFARESRQRVSSESKDVGVALLLYLADTEVFRQSERLANVEERLKIELPDTMGSLNEDLATNIRSQEFYSDKFEKMVIRLNAPRKFMASASTVRSEAPIGTKVNMIIGLSLVLGLMLGVFAAFFIEFLPKFRIQLRQAVGG